MKTIVSTLVLFIAFSCLSQKAPFKFGKLTKEEFSVKECSFYPEAQSMILGKYGFLRIVYNDNVQRWNYEMDVIVRKKIFSKEDKDAGSIKIRVYDPVEGTREEDVRSLKGVTYNVKAGKLEKTKLAKSSVFETRINDYVSEVSFTFPDVQEGSVIEYSYTIGSDFINSLNTWNFQSNVPVAYSEFVYRIPEYFDYQVSQEGSVILLESSKTERNETFTYSYMTQSTIQNATPRKVSNTMSSNSSQTQMIARDLLPIIDEPYMNNKVNIPNRLEFQLRSYKMPGAIREYVAGSYEKFNAEMLDRSSFGEKLSEGNFAKDKIAEIGNVSKTQMATQLHSWLQGHFTWNGYNGFTSSDAGRKAFKDAEGNVSDINLSYIAACREAGITAYPVILSTRGNGTPHPIYPAFDRFNYVLALVELDEGSFLVDPSSDLPFGSIPLKCRNYKGWKVSETGGSWIDLKSNSDYGSSVLITYEFDDENIKSKVSCKEDGYKAFATLDSYQKEGEESYFQNIEKNMEEWMFENPIMEESQWNMPVKYSYEITQEIDDASTIYLTPLLTGVVLDNPFKRETRMSNIDFAYNQSYMVIAQLNLPEGYSAELPASTAISLPDKAGSFTYTANQNGQTVQVLSSFKLNKTDFSSKEYGALKQFYQLMVDKNKEVVILKKGT